MNTSSKMPIRFVGLICLISVVFMVFSLSKDPSPAFVPPPFDASAQSGVPSVPEDLGYGEVDAKVFRVSVCGVIQAQDGFADLWLTNPAENDLWLKVRMLDAQGKTLGETGLIKPGEYVQSVSLAETPPPNAEITLKIMSYEPETYASAGAVSLNTTIQPSS